MCPRTELPPLFCLSLLIKVSCIHRTWGRGEYLHLAGRNCILFLCWRWPCIWWTVAGHGRDRCSVVSSLGVGAVYSSLGDCTIWPNQPLSPLSVPATLGHCLASCGWVSLAQQAALEWCVKTAGTRQALFAMVTSAIATPGLDLVTPNPEQRSITALPFLPSSLCALPTS